MYALLGMDGDIGLTQEQLEDLYHDLPEGELGAEIVRLALSRLGDPYSQPNAGQGAIPIAATLPSGVIGNGNFYPRTAAAQGNTV
jgi:hypothetical protein